MDDENNIWEQMETHMQQNLGRYGLEMFNIFLHLKECAEDCGMCPPDTPERQERFEQMNGEAHVPGSRHTRQKLETHAHDTNHIENFVGVHDLRHWLAST